MVYSSSCLKMVFFQCFIRVFLAKNFLATENVKNMPIFDQKWAPFQNFRRLRRRKQGHFQILITPPFGGSLLQYRVLMYIFIRASIGGVTCQKLGGDLEVQKDQNFVQKSPQKTNCRRRRRRKFLKHEKLEEFQGKFKFIQEKFDFKRKFGKIVP